MSARWTATKNARILNNMAAAGASPEARAAMLHEMERQGEKWRHDKKASQNAPPLRPDAPGTTDRPSMRVRHD